MVDGLKCPSSGAWVVVLWRQRPTPLSFGGGFDWIFMDSDKTETLPMFREINVHLWKVRAARSWRLLSSRRFLVCRPAWLRFLEWLSVGFIRVVLCEWSRRIGMPSIAKQLDYWCNARQTDKSHIRHFKLPQRHTFGNVCLIYTNIYLIQTRRLDLMWEVFPIWDVCILSDPYMVIWRAAQVCIINYSMSRASNYWWREHWQPPHSMCLPNAMSIAICGGRITIFNIHILDA